MNQLTLTVLHVNYLSIFRNTKSSPKCSTCYYVPSLMQLVIVTYNQLYKFVSHLVCYMIIAQYIYVKFSRIYTWCSLILYCCFVFILIDRCDILSKISCLRIL